MEHHQCKLFKNDESFDDGAECWFEILTDEWSGIKQGIGEIQSTQNLITKAISERSEYEMLLDDGRRGKIIITNITSDNPKRGSFKTSGPLE